MESDLGISVIVCCYNSSERLEQTLFHLAKLQPAGVPVELIVVDNNSSDGTSEVALSIWKKAGDTFRLKICQESSPGLSNARKTGVRHARYMYLIFCDDDNWLTPDYLIRAIQVMKSNHKIGAAGGRSEPAFDKGAIVPEWFDKFKDGYAVGHQASSSGDVTTRRFLWGAGLIIRKHLFELITDPKYPMLLTGRKGAELSAGDDSEICLRLIIIGYNLYYDDRLFFYHYIPTVRLTDLYKDTLFKGFVETRRIFDKYYFFLDHYINNNNRFFNHLKWNVKYWLMRMRIFKRIDSLVQDRMLSIYTNYQFSGLDEEMRMLFKLSKHSESRLKLTANAMETFWQKE